MRKRLIKNNIKDGILTIEMDNSNIDNIYEDIPILIKVCDKKYNIVLNYENTDIVDDSYLNNNIKDDRVIDIIEVITAINKKNIEDRYNYIYDKVCKKLDEKIKTNYCEFKNNICIKYREKNSNHQNGCCECKGRGRCKYLVDGVCTMKSCMACKLFTCHTLRKKGINQNINDFTLTKYFFTNKQKDILQFSYWTPKEIVMERLLKKVK